MKKIVTISVQDSRKLPNSSIEVKGRTAIFEGGGIYKVYPLEGHDRYTLADLVRDNAKDIQRALE